MGDAIEIRLMSRRASSFSWFNSNDLPRVNRSASGGLSASVTCQPDGTCFIHSKELSTGDSALFDMQGSPSGVQGASIYQNVKPISRKWPEIVNSNGPAREAIQGDIGGARCSREQPQAPSLSANTCSNVDPVVGGPSRVRNEEDLFLRCGQAVRLCFLNSRNRGTQTPRVP